MADDTKKNADPRRKPPWLKVRAFGGQGFSEISGLLRERGLFTVCQEANCPNRGECYNRGTATFLIMGPLCTRNCRFCNVHPGQPQALNPEEPRLVADAVARMQLRHAVVTSVTRDDLPDGGARHFAETIEAIRKQRPDCTIEVLTPDFKDAPEALGIVMAAGPDIFNHNVETVPRLYREVRPGADYQRSLELLERAGREYSVRTKSGLMVGLGETMDELVAVFTDLAEHGVTLLTVGQYLSPSKEHLPVDRYVPPEEFDVLAERARSAGIPHVFAGPLVRSSYLADSMVKLI
ncbi:lipoyl synthase [candidate division GN15 bacterium]|nr:lipoyl synthase [candidate division GN15 bacterium]